MAVFNPYLIFDGNAAAAFDFYKSVFGGEFSFVMKASDSADQSDQKLDPAENNKLMHICLPLPNGQLLQASDMIYSYCNASTAPFNPGNNQYICIKADNEAEARSLYEKLSKGATIQCALQPMFWGDLFGQLTDQFGIQWMINTPLEKKAETDKI